MNISDSIKKLGVGVDKPVLDKATGKAGASKASNESAANTDSVTLSSTSVQLQSDISNTEVYDAKKVEEIKAAIERGDFSVDTGKVADGLLQSVKDLLHAK